MIDVDTMVTSYAESPVQPEWSGWTLNRVDRGDWSRWTWAVTRTRSDGDPGTPVAHIVRYRDRDKREYVLTTTDGGEILPEQSYPESMLAWNRAIELFEAGQLPIKP